MSQPDNSDIAAQAWTTTQAHNRTSLQHWCDLATGMHTVRGEWKAPILIALSEAARDIPGLGRRLQMTFQTGLPGALVETGMSWGRPKER